MIKIIIISITVLVAVSNGQNWSRPGAYRGYGNNVGHSGLAQPGYAVGYQGIGRGNVAYGGGYTRPAAYGGAYARPVAYGGAYASPATYGGAYASPATYGGAYAPPVASVGVAPIAPQVGVVPVARPQYYGGRYEDESYKPYSFGYNNVDEYGTQLGRQEVADGSGSVRGSYSYRDPTGQFRQVQYVADGAGFRAEVDTNEAGVISHRPADAVYRVHK